MTGQHVTGTVVRPLRADARRNRDAILRAAREAFEAEGALTSLDGIAARAGVGNATLYRNFPTRDDLLAAVMESSIAAAVSEADELSGTLSPREALAEWLVRLTWRLRVWHDLPTCLVGTGGGDGSPVQSACHPLLVRTRALVQAAASADATVEAVTGDELWELVLALSWGVDRFGDDEVAARRRATLATAGIFT